MVACSTRSRYVLALGLWCLHPLCIVPWRMVLERHRGLITCLYYSCFVYFMEICTSLQPFSWWSKIWRNTKVTSKVSHLRSFDSPLESCWYCICTSDYGNYVKYVYLLKYPTKERKYIVLLFLPIFILLCAMSFQWRGRSCLSTTILRYSK